MFPIDLYKTEIIDKIKEFDWLIINASPGSGKTTRVPIFLDEIFDKRIYILEPRRLPAKLSSQYVAKSLNSKVGERVGYIYKYENVTGPQTKIIFLTEGTFLNILRDKNKLSEISAVILDEFHERHLFTDMALSFLIKIKKEMNLRFKVIIMSATIDADSIVTFINAPTGKITQTESRFPLNINHLPNDPTILKRPLEEKVMAALEKSKSMIGNRLIFLPGLKEIYRVQALIEERLNVSPYILHGGLETIDFEKENFNSELSNKIILSTNIAESSVTIPGVKIVIDSGLVKKAGLSKLTHLKTIETIKANQASSIQRANRANRTSKGEVYRLFSNEDFSVREKFHPPEISSTDLFELIIKSYELFLVDPSNISFLTPPPSDEIARSLIFLKNVGIIKNNQLSDLGLAVSALSIAPRLGLLIIMAYHSLDQKEFEHTLKFVSNLTNEHFEAFSHQIKKTLSKVKMIEFDKINSMSEGIFLTHQDHLAMSRSTNRFELIHRNGQIFKIAKDLHEIILKGERFWVILELNHYNEISKVSEVEEDWIINLDSSNFETKINYDYDLKSNKLRKNTKTYIDSLLLDESSSVLKTLDATDLDYLSNILTSEIATFISTDEFIRYYFLEKHSSNTIAHFNLDNFLKGELENFINGDETFSVRLFENLKYEIKNFLDPLNLFDLKNDLPTEIVISGKRQIKIEYDLTNGIHARGPIQFFYGIKSLPNILRGKEKLIIHLEGPHKRDLQTTSNLELFWNTTYKEIVPELKRDYPRHYWPLNPESARPYLLLKEVK